ncbi:uncharacterized protein LOC108465583 [Gossypium arboreum]|uniref:uncharacterized protein LOC108465583 n=1 Tax=Gossypium arboreum TaxID=29729 RepID=UPI000818FDF9|nr:uncharacterized protein LOC108465583 [Gossypium arboreum]
MRLNDEQVTFSVFESNQCKEKKECHIIDVLDDLIEKEFNDQSTILSEEFAVTFDAESSNDYDSNHNTLLVVVSATLDVTQEEKMIKLEDEGKKSIEQQRRLNEKMKEVVKKEIIKWLDAGIIYLISDSNWVSLVQSVPKKSGITVVHNDKDELIPTCIPMGWLVCMDYRKLNAATKKDHFPLPFIDQMLDRLAGNAF